MTKRLKKFVAIATLMASFMMIATPADALTAEELAEQIADLQAQLVLLTAQLAELTGEEAVVVSGCDISSFDRNLELGDTGDDVKCLQIVLNSDSDTQLADSGVGSSGEETSYFGPLTKAAVIKFQELYADEVLASWGLTTGTGFVGSTTRAKLNELLVAAEEEEPVGEPGDYDNEADCETANYYWYDDVCNAEAEEEEEATGGGLNIALSSVTPASTTVITYGADDKQAQVLVPFTTVNFTAGSEGSVTVTTLKFTRTGIAADANLDNTYLYEGDVKLIEGGSLSSKVVTFNDANGIFTVPAGETKSITLMGNLNSAASAGKTIGFSLVSADDITSDASAVSGTFSAVGNLMAVATATDLGYAMITGNTVPTGATTINPQDDYMVWKFNLAANQQNLDLERITFSEIGSINPDDLQNFELYYGGTILGTAEMDSNYQVIFDLSDSPFRITKGQTKILKLYADILKGSNRSFKFTVQYPTDIMLKDANYGVYVGSYITIGAWTTVQPDESYTIGVGTLSVTKRTDSSVGNVSLDGTNVSLAKYDFKAAGEDVKVNSLKVSADTTAADGLDNGMVYLDGVQVGSTKDINEYTAATVAEATSFTFGTSFIVSAGTTSVVEIKADIKEKDTVSFNPADTITVYVMGSGTVANAQTMSSLTILDVPETSKAANQLTVQEGALTFTKSTSYGTQSTVKPATEFKIGSFSMLAGSTEGVNVDSITVDFTSTTEAGYMENLLLKVGADEVGSTKVTLSTSNLFSVNIDLAKGGSKIVDVYADILSDASDLDAEVYGTGTTVDTSASVLAGASDATITLQSIVVADGSLTVALASNTPDSGILTGMSPDVELAKYTFSSLFEAFTVSEVKIETLQNTDDDITSLYLKYKDAAGLTVTSGALPLIGGEAHFVAMTFNVPANMDADLTVYGNLNTVAPSGYANTGDQPQLSLTYYKASSGSQSSLTGPAATEYNNVTLTTGTNASSWSTVQENAGSYSVLLNAVDAGHSYVEFTPAVGITVNDLATITNTSFWYYASAALGPLMELRFTEPGYDPDDGYGHVDITVDTAESSPTLGAWTEVTVTSASTAFDYGNDPTDGTAWGAADQHTLAAILTAINAEGAMTAATPDDTATAWELTRVRIEIGWGSTRHCYIDDVEIDDVVYTMEPMIGGNQMLLYKTKPTVALTGTYSTDFSSGTNVLYPFTVAADSKGNVGLKTLIFNVTMATNASGVLNTFKFYRGGDDITDEVTITGSATLTNGGGAACNLEDSTCYFDTDDTSIVTVTFATEEIITADTSQTYYLRANATTISTVGDSVQTYLKDDTTYDAPEDIPGEVISGTTASFVWTDRSVPSAYHSEDEDADYFSDWLNGYLVDTLPGDIVTLSK